MTRQPGLSEKVKRSCRRLRRIERSWRARGTFGWAVIKHWAVVLVHRRCCRLARLLQSKETSLSAPGSRGHTFHLGRPLNGSRILSGSPEQQKQTEPAVSEFPAIDKTEQREHVSLHSEDRFQRCGQEVGVHTFHPYSSGRVTKHRCVTNVT